MILNNSKKWVSKLNTNLTSDDNKTIQGSPLSGYDEAKIYSNLLEYIESKVITCLPESAAQRLFLEQKKILESKNAESTLREKISALPPEELEFYAKLLIIKNSCRSASAIIAITNSANFSNPYDIEHMFDKMKQTGLSAHQLQKIIGTITNWRTGTPHPTQHLSEVGKQLFRDLIGISKLPLSERLNKAQKTIDAMFEKEITRQNRMTIQEETISDRKQAKLHRLALKVTYRSLNRALDKYFPTNTPNLLSGSVRMTIRYHTWFGGGDADGKANADKKALLEGMVGYTHDAIQEHLNDLEYVIKLQPSLAQRLKNIFDSLDKVKTRLQTIEEKLLSDNDELSFDTLKQSYRNVYDGLSVDYVKDGDLSVNSEKEFYVKLTNDLRDAVDNNANGEAKQSLSEILFVMRQYKNNFTTAKIEKRANGLIDIEIMNKLFGDKQFQAHFLTGAMARALANRNFTDLSKSEQREMMRYVGGEAQNDRQIIINHYRRIFPEYLDDKGFPNQLRERGERLILRAISPDKFGMDIVAEAQEMSAEYAYFLGEELFGVRKMMHTMLNEDLESLEQAPDFLIDFSEHGGHESIKNAVAHNPRLELYLKKHGAMLPCSDSVKQLGPGAFFLLAQAINLIMKFCVQNYKTVCIKWGNGQTLTRGGGNAHVPGRLKAQALQWHLNGRHLKIDEQDDMSILANIMFSSNTEQGRAADFMSPNADKISYSHQKMIGEMLGRSMELMGLVDRGTYISQVSDFSPGVRRILSSIAKDIMMRGYENFRDAVDENGNRVSDSVANLTSNMKIAQDANQAARPDSKIANTPPKNSLASSSKVKNNRNLYDLRAIGTTIAISHMRSHHDGWFSLGAGLQALHMAFINNEVGYSDLRVFLDDPLWANIIKNGLRTASMSDIPYLFRKLNSENWSHSKAMQVGKNVFIDHMKFPPKFSTDLNDDITAEQAYVAKLYYDQALFITYTEQLAKIKFEETELPQTPEEIEKLAELQIDNFNGKIGKFSLGAYTNVAFPMVDQELNGNRLDALSSQIICDVAEERHGELNQQQRNTITAAQRSSAQVFYSVDLFYDQDAYGSYTLPKRQYIRKKHISEKNISSPQDLL